MLGANPVILLSVGTQLAFPRLVEAVDLWAERHRDVRVVGQIGPQTRGLPRHIDAFDFMAIEGFEALQRECRLMISHAGVGSILKAHDFGKPIIIMPRRSELGEHRSNHQVATARYFVNMPNVTVATDEFELLKLLNRHEEFVFSDSDPETTRGAMCDAIAGELRDRAAPGTWLRMVRKIGL
jgi:UDP-N-acetylglucosamine transferase subunit ALG13